MKRRGVLTEEDKRLWSAVARTARPLPGRALLPEPPEDALAGAGRTPEAQVRPGTAPRPDIAPGPPARSHIVQETIDRPVRRKLGRGRLEIDARIDLHGKTEAVAHYALLGFLRSAHGMGLRHVLVITGRGSSSGSTGALRRAFPHWIATDAFRRLVSGFDVAERSHGGDGAFYVRLRKT
ncbi:Smr/MutS family protein [Aureimonas sp. OT7]|uniref:Smr/MutS family protein n=1 Tax=Aureimonas sp. OT7 TaxID=2816454 RepID=UPI00177C55AA|nr:Smr/MutS family protein [Aureimonas sp. OT7]QOG07081.1 Smr/MutS family protein [Aureimonas sp. OT7]